MPANSRTNSMTKLLAAVAVLFAAAPVYAQIAGVSAQGAADEAGTKKTFNWFLQGTTPAGNTVLVEDGDGGIKNETFVHWNNREYTIRSEVRFGRNGMILEQRITGISPFKSPIDEVFSYEDGVASWSTVGNSGSARVEEPGFYVNNEMGALEALPALVRAALQRMDNELPLLPTGTATVERITDVEVETGSGKQTASLFSVSGINLTPMYFWLDKDLEILAVDFGGYLGMIPEGWDSAALAELSAIQTRESAAHAQAMAADLATPFDQPVIFENVDIVDVATGELMQDYFVKVEGGRIAAISNLPVDSDGVIKIDATGKTLLPGLWDMHGHFGLEDGILNIAGGVTNVRIIGGVHDKIMEMTEKQDSGAVVGPNTYRAGFIDKSGPYASGWNAGTLPEVLERVDFYAENGYRQIKLYSSIEPEWVAPIAERTHAHGMRLSGHIPAFMSAEQAIKAGYDEIQHINMVFLNFIAGDQADTRQQLRFSLYGDKAADVVLDSEEVEEFIDLLKRENVVVDPTAAIFETMLIHRVGEPNPIFAKVADHLPPAVSRGIYSPEFPNAETWSRSAPNQAAMLKKLYESGVQLVPGSDNMAAFTIHRELEVYAEAGIPTAAVLKMATLDSARVVGVESRTGSIEVGKDADLVLLDGNPLEDISAVRRAVLVMKRGTAYRPDELYKAVGVKPFVESTGI